MELVPLARPWPLGTVPVHRDFFNLHRLFSLILLCHKELGVGKAQSYLSGRRGCGDNGLVLQNKTKPRYLGWRRLGGRKNAIVRYSPRFVLQKNGGYAPNKPPRTCLPPVLGSRQKELLEMMRRVENAEYQPSAPRPRGVFSSKQLSFGRRNFPFSVISVVSSHSEISAHQPHFWCFQEESGVPCEQLALHRVPTPQGATCRQIFIGNKYFNPNSPPPPGAGRRSCRGPAGSHFGGESVSGAQFPRPLRVPCGAG